jgi:hypothetical protein
MALAFVQAHAVARRTVFACRPFSNVVSVLFAVLLSLIQMAPLHRIVDLRAVQEK